MFMKPSQPHPEVEAEKPTKTVNQHSHSQTKFPLRKVRRIPRPDMKVGLGYDRAQKDEPEVRKILKICRKAAEHGKDPGFRRAHEDELEVRKILKICRKTAEEVQVGTPHVANVLAHAHREASRGAEGWATGLQRKEKAIQKRRLRKLSRIKRAGEYWEKRSPTQETSGASNNKERHKKQIRISARVIRTSDPRLRTQKIIFSVKDPGMKGHRLGDVMSLRFKL